MQNFFKLVGNSFRPFDCQVALSELQPGDTLTLIPEPTNPYDSNAVKVMSADHHLGYVAKEACADILAFIATYPSHVCRIYTKFGKTTVCELLPSDA